MNTVKPDYNTPWSLDTLKIQGHRTVRKEKVPPRVYYLPYNMDTTTFPPTAWDQARQYGTLERFWEHQKNVKPGGPDIGEENKQLTPLELYQQALEFEFLTRQKYHASFKPSSCSDQTDTLPRSQKYRRLSDAIHERKAIEPASEPVETRHKEISKCAKCASSVLDVMYDSYPSFG